MKQITKKYKDEIFVWDPLSFGGKGYWYVLGTKGGYGRAASKKEAKSLGKPEVPKEISPHTESPTKTHTEEIEPTVGDEDEEERMAPSAKSIKRARYREAERIKGTKLSELITNNLIEGKGAIGSVTGAIGNKVKARGTRLKKMFDLRERMHPLNIAKFLTGGSSMGPALLGRMLGSSQEDIEHYSGRRAKGGKGTASLIRSALTGKKITPVDSGGNAASDAAQKLVNLFSKYFEDKKREMEIKRSFEEEKESEELRRHKQLIEAITGKPYRAGATASKMGTGGSLLDMLLDYAGPAARLAANAATTAARFMFANPIGLVATGGLALSVAATSVLASDAGKPLRESFKAENDPNGMLSAMSGDTGIAANILMNSEQNLENAIAGKKANLLADRPSDKKSMLFWKDGDLQKKYLEEVGWDEKTGTIKKERDAGAIGIDAKGKLVYKPQGANAPAPSPAAPTTGTTVTPPTAPATSPPLPSGVMAPPPVSTSPAKTSLAAPIPPIPNSGQRIETAMLQQNQLAGSAAAAPAVIQNNNSVTIPGQNTTGVVGNNPVRNLDESLERVQMGSLRNV